MKRNPFIVLCLIDLGFLTWWWMVFWAEGEGILFKIISVPLFFISLRSYLTLGNLALELLLKPQSSK